MTATSAAMQPQPGSECLRKVDTKGPDRQRGVRSIMNNWGKIEAVPGRPYPTSVFHMTRVEHLASIARSGLMNDNAAQSGTLIHEIGNLDIKARRRARRVDAWPGGVVADYAPFYFNPRSPMQSSIHKGNVPSYRDGNDRLVFLVTSTQRLRDLGLPVVVSDRNAVLDVAQFTDDDDLDDFVAWEVIRTRYWNDYIEGRELRQAECLVHERVPWTAFVEVACKSQPVADEASRALRVAGGTGPHITVRPSWYF
ncbi:MAG: DUF4433 domain-containing protein [Propionibacteriaceae bacterium]|nr:DUF4433 domain-containing protein [Propionibacteriaceae bacterium]